jgi:Fic family protein
MSAVDGQSASLASMEPLLIAEGSRHRAELNDLALELAQRSAGFRRSLPASFVPALAALVRAMNCYYSNLIEGHDTHPIDIERALKGDYSDDARKRDLQLEATAHIAVQAWIDGGALAARAFETDALREIHRRFCEALPEELLRVIDPATGERLPVVPGEFRQRHVAVGQHVPVGPGAVQRFLDRLADAYGRLGKTDTIVAAAAAHHRLLWVHPFLDGNGRVARLQSHAILLNTLDTGAIWSVARGLARRVGEYKAHLAACDRARRNDFDERGALSEESLVEFTRFFLSTCIDQVRFMEGLMQPDLLQTRMRLWAEEEMRLGRLPNRAPALLEAILYRGELPRGDVAAIVGSGDRQARRVVAALVDAGVLQSESSRAALRLAFPATLASRWMPGLFPERVG